MSRPKLKANPKVTAGGRYDVALVTAFAYLTKQHGLSIAQALERLMVDALIKRAIPGVTPLDYDAVNKEMPFSHTKPASAILNSGESKILYEPQE